MEPIKDLEIYNARMRKSMYDKLWFVNKLPEDITTLYDYGCGDGTLLTLAKGFFTSDIETIGYDVNPKMRKLASGSFWLSAVVDKPLTEVPAGTCVIASSVLHEIHAYANNIDKEYGNIFGIGADYVAVRDMFCGDIGDFSGPFNATIVRPKANQEMVSQFEEIYGPIAMPKNLVHFLLKYRYTENWDRELHENYFPITVYNLYKKAKEYGYEVIYSHHYTPYFIKSIVKKDFGIDLDVHTHAEILFKRIK